MDRGRGQAINPLALVEILEPLSEEELQELAVHSPEIHLQRSEDFYRELEHDSGLFLLKSGRVQVYRLSLRGSQLTLVVLSAGSVLAGRRMRGLYAQAMEPSVVCFVRRRDLNLLVGRRPELGLRLIDLLSDDLRMMDELLYDVVYKEVPARLASLILRLLGSEGVVNREGYKIPTYYTHAQLGSMIGARRVAVSRALGHLRQGGMVETTPSGIRVRDAGACRRRREVVVPKAERKALTTIERVIRARDTFTPEQDGLFSS